MSEEATVAAVANVEAAAAVLEHIREHVGGVDTVFHEVEAESFAVDIHHVPPGEGHDSHTLVTTGMSDTPMPEGAGVAFGELVMRLPADWPMGEEDLEEDAASWPLAMLKALGRLPHEDGVAYDFGLCIEGGRLPLEMAADTGFAGVLLAPPVTIPDAFWCLEAAEGKVIDFFGVVMLYPDELALAKSEGIVALAHKLDALKVTELLQPGRKSAA